MSRIATYPTPWLDCRYPFDVRARHLATEAAALAALPTDRTVRLVDLGCGHGANIRYFWPRLGYDQHWTLIDSDPNLLQAALAGMEALGIEAGYTARVAPGALTLQRGPHCIEIETVEASLLDLSKLVALPTVDLVLANAVFDLFSEAQTVALLREITAQSAMLLTLNYTGMAFAPVHPLDALVIGWYEAHMQRPQSFGEGMGATGPARIEAWLAGEALDFYAGSSVWEVLPQDREMLGFLLGFMEEAIPELGLTPPESQKLNDWLHTRRAEMTAGKLSCRVWHRDVWAK